MTPQKKNKIRALILLMVFSLNTVAGFACSIGVDMGYNKKHHEKKDSHSHEGMKQHAHPDHNTKQQHHHKDTYTNVVISETGKDDCCGNEVTNFIKLDKLVVKNPLTLQTPVFLLAFASSFLLFQDQIKDNVTASPHLRRSCTLYDTDIRIVIQSFQI